jgi:glycosyltransferase involved in cell wall biosynthesis
LEKGIGGSEEAVIHMARRLGARGWHVEIYNSVPERRVFGNVEYRPFWEFNYLDANDICISWRNPALFEYMEVNAKKKYVWIHDMMQSGEFTPERWSKCDKLMFLSKAHREAYPHVPEDKVMYTANGLDVENLLKDAEGAERIPWKMINTSAPDRGLHCLLKMWPKIKEKYPEATFYWFYGWQTYDNYNANNPERMAFKDEIVKLLKQPGVFEGGRISHGEIAEQMASSDLWVYPTEFFETSCITAMKAQALGAVPVTTKVGALKETVFSGEFVDTDSMYSDEKAQEEWSEKLALARSCDRDNMQKEAQNRFNWDTVVDGWEKEFLCLDHSSLDA